VNAESEKGRDTGNNTNNNNNNIKHNTADTTIHDNRSLAEYRARAPASRGAHNI